MTASSIYARTSDVIATDVAGEVVLLHTGNWQYFEFDKVGAAIWALLETPRDLDGLVDELMRRFAVSQDQCARETRAFLEEGVANGVILVDPV